MEEGSLSGFRSAHYCPVHPGDLIHAKYTVRVKLGYGRSSTTWLCTDEKKKFKVLKVFNAADNKNEVKVLEYLRSQWASSDNPGRYCVRQPDDSFVVQKFDRSYQCIVFPPLGPDLVEFVSQRDTRTMNLIEVRWVVIYLLHAVNFLHSSGVVHTDIKLDNIQIILPDNEEDVLAAFVAENENKSKVIEADPEESTIYQSHRMKQEELRFPILCDLGMARFGQSASEGLAQPLPYRAPEVILGATWDSKIDIWSIGVLIWELLFAERLFGHTDEQESIKMMICYLGLPPRAFLKSCSRQAEFFDETGQYKAGEVAEVRLEDRVEFDEAFVPLFRFLRSTLAWDPRERQNASSLLAHPWLQELA